MRALYRIFLFAVAAALFAMTAVQVGGAEAQTPSDKVTVLALDTQSLTSDKATAELTMSAVGLLLQLKKGQPFMFVFDDEFTDVAGSDGRGRGAFYATAGRGDGAAVHSPR